MRSAAHRLAIGGLWLVVECALVNHAVHGAVVRSGGVPPSAPRPEPLDRELVDQPITPPPPFVSVWLEAPGDPILPVFDGVVVQRDGWLAVVGGMTGEFVTTPAIQLRHPERGWRPIGSQLLEGRARFTMTPLGDGRFLVVGGVQGSMGEALLPLASVEVVDPFVAGSREAPPLDEPLVGHTAHALGEGRVLVIGGQAARVFEMKSMQWTEFIPLLTPRRDHASVVLPDGSTLIVGGDERGTIERIEFMQGSARSQRWAVRLPHSLSRHRAVLMSDGSVMVVGGVNGETGRSESRTWRLDPRMETIEPGPDLRFARGIADAEARVDAGRLLVLGGEWVAPGERGEVDGARMWIPREQRLWSLAPLPYQATRRMWYTTGDDRPAALGGYRFLDEAESKREGLPPGPAIPQRGMILRVGGPMRMTD